MLRNILYLDVNAINDYFSEIYGYSYEEEVITNNSSNSKGGKFGVQFSVAKSEINLNNDKSSTFTKNVKITNATKLDKIIKYLEKEKELKYYQCIDEESWNDICRNEFLEILGTPRFSKIQEMSDMARNLNYIVDSFQPFFNGQIVDNEVKKSIDALESLSKLNSSNSITCVFNFEDNKYPVITYLNEEYLKISKDNFKSSCYMLCKVQQKVEKGKKIELDEIFENIKYLNLNREQKRKLPKDLSNPKEIKDVIKGPALVVTPIAIYR